MFQIDGKPVGGDRCYTIAELGHNHCGSVEIAKRLIRAAHEAGADAAKLQVRHNRSLYTRAAYEAAYQSENAYGPTYGEHRKALELTTAEHVALRNYAAQIGITLFATAFDQPSVDLCVDVGYPAIKIASGDLTNTPLISYASGAGIPLLISTGGGTTLDVVRILDLLAHRTDWALLQCTASYPCVYDELDLGVIAHWSRSFDVVVGASLHANGISAAVAAYCMGARIIEQHLTLNRTMKGTDHPFSLEPQGFRKLVRDLRRVEVSLGDAKRVHDSEREPIRKMSKSCVASHDLPVGHVVTNEDVAFKSPGGGLPPYRAIDLMGIRLDREMAQDDTFEEADLATAPTAARAVLGARN